MNIAFVSVWEKENEEFFKESDSTYGEGIFSALVALKKLGSSKGINIDHISAFVGETIDACVFHEVPPSDNHILKFCKKHGIPMFLFTYEPEVVYPQSHQLKNHREFVKVFTHLDQLVDGRKYIKINLSSYDFESRRMKRNPKSGFLVLINSNKGFYNSLELYTKRYELIQWFVSNHPHELDVYGRGWDPRWTCYKGITSEKCNTMSTYRYSVCYENSQYEPGYITEKIFDSFFSGTVPIYWGCDNINQYVPANCFIDRRKFSSNEELYNFLKAITDDEYDEYLSAISDFLVNSRGSEFSVQYFAHTMLEHILEGIQQFHLGETLESPHTAGYKLFEGKGYLAAGQYNAAEKSFQWAASDNEFLWRGDAELGLIKALIAQEKYSAALERINQNRVRNDVDEPADIAYWESVCKLNVGIAYLAEFQTYVHYLRERSYVLDDAVTHSSFVDPGILLWKVHVVYADFLRATGNFALALEAYKHAHQVCPDRDPEKPLIKQRIDALKGVNASDVIN